MTHFHGEPGRAGHDKLELVEHQLRGLPTLPTEFSRDLQGETGARSSAETCPKG